MQISLEDIKRARETRDLQLPGLCIALVQADRPKRRATSKEAEMEEEADKALERYFTTIDSREFAALPELEKARYRVEQFKAIESEKAVKTPERYRLYPVLIELWQNNGLYERRCLKEIISGAPMVHGVWKAVKRIYKEAEEKQDTEIFGAIAARLDAELARGAYSREVRRGTIIYMVRRAWRFLRTMGNNFSSLYCRSAVDLLKAYPESTQWQGTWIANHIIYHETRRYGSKQFRSGFNRQEQLKHRAFARHWQQDPQPLLRLLEEACSSTVRNFAAASLKKEHQIALREISASTVLGLLKAGQKEIDTFCVWLFDSVPRFEQSRLRELGLHDAVIGLLRSQSPQGLQFAATYVRSHAKDLPLEQVLELVNHSNKEVRELAVALLGERDPRKDIGLEAWARLLGTPHGNTLAENAIMKHFSAKELTPQWFATLFMNSASHPFAVKQLPKVYKLKDLGPGYFIDIFHHKDFDNFGVSSLMESLNKFNNEELDTEFLREALFSTWTRHWMLTWVRTGYCDTGRFGVDFLLSLAVEAEWEKSAWIQERIAGEKEQAKKRWPETFSGELSQTILGWLSDVRKFQPKEIGFSRLMELVKNKEERYHQFALQYMTKAFVPADFAPQEEKEEEIKGEVNIDLEGRSFLFTGKLMTMTREEAQKKVTGANGKNGAGVTKTLDYLVIGDEGSPLYNAGKKGSKQLKAESLIEAGASLKIISETAFLQMLSGRKPEADQGATLAGCEKLWEFVVKKGSEQNPVRLFAIHYIRHHHQDMGPRLTERPVDPGAEVPHDFFTFDRLFPLFQEKRESLRNFALELARWEAARWNPSFRKLVELCETGEEAVKAFIAKALTAGPEKAHERYRLNQELITPANVYRLCESPEDFARNLGIQLLNLHPRLAEAGSLFRLTESTDRKMRYFAVEMIWRSFRNRGVSANWTPPEEKEQVDRKPPDPWLSDEKSMKAFFRRMLFEIPPGRNKSKGVKTLPSGKAKIALVETYRNMALRDATFAAMVVPALEEFMASKGLMEERACLVALARIAGAHPDLEPVKRWQENRRESAGV